MPINVSLPRWVRGGPQIIFGFLHPPAPHWVIVHIMKTCPKIYLVTDGMIMIALLPKFAFAASQSVGRAGYMAFKAHHHLGQDKAFAEHEESMKMVIQDNVPKKPDAPIVA